MWCWLALALLWSAPLAAQLLSPGELAKPHAELEGLQQCTQCHTLGKKVDEGHCLECHQKLAKRIRAGQGYHAALKQPCIDCHSDHRGRQYQMVRWNPEAFDHAQTGYLLEEAHSRLKCVQCHKERSFLGLSRDCLSCHADQHQGQLATDCLSCHTLAAWKPAGHFDHERSAFQLRGKHAQVACAKCHPQGKYKGLPFQQCRGCHQDPHRPTLGNDCQRCHAVEGWKQASQGFDHERAAFPLRGKHMQVECAKCHQQGKYKGLPFQQCRGCHQDPHRPTLGNDCQRCHTVAGWKQASQGFDHERTVFPLRGKHAQVECAKCHQQERYKGLAFQQCRDCHQDYHQGQFIQDCAGCHVLEGWKPAALFDHERSAFRLRGKHVQVECAKCHQQGRYRPLAQQCRDCHQDIHQGQFAQDCALCHVVEDWKQSRFDHERAAFKLDGAHIKVQCEQCHFLEQAAGNEFRRYRPLPASCQACHG